MPAFVLMPIKITYGPAGSNEEVAWLCDSNWRLPDQVSALEAWLNENKATLKTGRYGADVGFSVREDAFGGGAVISPEMMRTMADLGMSLFLSEYPSGDE